MAPDAHTTVEPEQTKTDTFAVFQAVPGEPNLQLVAMQEVPRYSQPNEYGVRLDYDKRLSVAVNRAVERDDTVVIGPDYYPVGPDELSEIEGTEFRVTDDLDGSMSFVEYDRNPSISGVWNPEEDNR